jgi:hypothetical protein
MQSLQARAQYRNSIHCAYRIFTEEGVTKFWKGTVPRLGRLIVCSHSPEHSTGTDDPVERRYHLYSIRKGIPLRGYGCPMIWIKIPFGLCSRYGMHVVPAILGYIFSLMESDADTTPRLSRREETDVDLGPLCELLLFRVVGDRTSGKDHDTWESALTLSQEQESLPDRAASRTPNVLIRFKKALTLRLFAVNWTIQSSSPTSTIRPPNCSAKVLMALKCKFFAIRASEALMCSDCLLEG